MPRTRENFITDEQHEWDGMILDAAIEGRRGAELSLWLKTMRAKIQLKLGIIYDELTRPDTVPFNGTNRKAAQ